MTDGPSIRDLDPLRFPDAVRDNLKKRVREFSGILIHETDNCARRDSNEVVDVKHVTDAWRQLFRAPSKRTMRWFEFGSSLASIVVGGLATILYQEAFRQGGPRLTYILVEGLFFVVALIAMTACHLLRD